MKNSIAVFSFLIAGFFSNSARALTCEVVPDKTGQFIAIYFGTGATKRLPTLSEVMTALDNTKSGFFKEMRTKRASELGEGEEEVKAATMHINIAETDYPEIGFASLPSTPCKGFKGTGHECRVEQLRRDKDYVGDAGLPLGEKTGVFIFTPAEKPATTVRFAGYLGCEGSLLTESGAPYGPKIPAIATDGATSGPQPTKAATQRAAKPKVAGAPSVAAPAAPAAAASAPAAATSAPARVVAPAKAKVAK